MRQLSPYSFKRSCAMTCLGQKEFPGKLRSPNEAMANSRVLYTIIFGIVFMDVIRFNHVPNSSRCSSKYKSRLPSVYVSRTLDVKSMALIGVGITATGFVISNAACRRTSTLEPTAGLRRTILPLSALYASRKFPSHLCDHSPLDLRKRVDRLYYVSNTMVLRSSRNRLAHGFNLRVPLKHFLHHKDHFCLE